MAFCINCGTKLPDGSKFCPNCGTQQPVVAAPAPVAAPEPVAVPEPVTIPEPVVVQQPEPAPVVQEARHSFEESASAPEPVAVPEPVVVQQPEPAPLVQEPVYQEPIVQQPIEFKAPVMQADYDMESGEEPEPVVGTYTIPTAAQIQAAKTSAPAQGAAKAPAVRQPAPKAQKAPKQPRKSGGFNPLPIIIGVVGGLLAIGIIICAVLIIKNTVGGSSAPFGDGTALVDILDNAASNMQYGQ